MSAETIWETIIANRNVWSGSYRNRMRRIEWNWQTIGPSVEHFCKHEGTYGLKEFFKRMSNYHILFKEKPLMLK